MSDQSQCLIYPDTILLPDTQIYPDGLCPPDPGIMAWQPLQVRPRSDSVRFRPIR